MGYSYLEAVVSTKTLGAVNDSCVPPTGNRQSGCKDSNAGRPQPQQPAIAFRPAHTPETICGSRCLPLPGRGYCSLGNHKAKRKQQQRAKGGQPHQVANCRRARSEHLRRKKTQHQNSGAFHSESQPEVYHLEDSFALRTNSSNCCSSSGATSSRTSPSRAANNCVREPPKNVANKCATAD